MIFPQFKTNTLVVQKLYLKCGCNSSDNGWYYDPIRTPSDSFCRQNQHIIISKKKCLRETSMSMLFIAKVSLSDR